MPFAPYEPGAALRLGTSSFSSKDWVGPFYPARTPPAAFLSHYARHFDTVEVDATYYAIPKPSVVDGWGTKTPDGFLLCAKFPRSIVHAGKGAAPDARHILDPDATYEDRDRFLDTMSRLGPKLGPLLIQFPYFNRKAFPSAGPFLDRLDAFLRDLPREPFRYAVEIRNKAWLKAPFVEMVRSHGVSLTLVDHGWMPHGADIDERFDVITGDDIYIRLLGDRKAIESITTTWEKEVVTHDASMLRWAKLIAKYIDQGVRVLVFVNNHYAGHAPATVQRLREMIAKQKEST